MTVREFYDKYKLWLALALFVALAVFAAKWIAFDVVEPSLGRVGYEKVCDDYGELSAPLIGDEVRQTLTISPGTPLYGVRFKHSSGGETSSGTLRVALLSESGETLRTAQLDASQLREDHFVEAVFDEPVAAEKYTARYILAISLEGASEGDPLALWRSRGQAAGYPGEQGGVPCGTLVLQFADERVSGGLLGAFWAIALFVIIGLALVFWLLFIKRVKLHIAFAVCAAVLGVAFAFVTPPLGAPDEDVHYATAYEYASGLLGEDKRASDGGLLMRACDKPRFNEAGRVAREYDAFAYSRFFENLTGAKAHDSEPVSVSVRSAYTIFKVLYAPQTLGISLARLCSMGGAATQLMGRLFNLAAYIALATYAVKKAPFGRAVFAVVALFPMSLQIAASMCYDALVLGMAFAFVSLALSCAYKEGRPTVVELALLGVLALLLAPSKGIYLPMVALVLIVAPKLFKNTKKGFAVMAAVVVAAGALWLAINGRSVLYEISGERAEVLTLTNEQLAETRPNGDAKHDYTFGYILARPDEAAILALRTLQKSVPLYLQGVVGGRLGEQILVNIEINWVLIIALITVALLSALKTREEPLIFKGPPKWLSLFITLCVAALTVLICMTWTPINHTTIYGIQGRYLLPVVPLALLALRNNTITLSRNIDRRLIFAAAALVYLVQLDAFSKIMAM